jgi:hypothetical protein
MVLNICFSVYLLALQIGENNLITSIVIHHFLIKLLGSYSDSDIFSKPYYMLNNTRKVRNQKVF